MSTNPGKIESIPYRTIHTAEALKATAAWIDRIESSNILQDKLEAVNAEISTKTPIGGQELQLALDAKQTLCESVLPDIDSIARATLIVQHETETKKVEAFIDTIQDHLEAVRKTRLAIQAALQPAPKKNPDTVREELKTMCTKARALKKSLKEVSISVVASQNTNSLENDIITLAIEVGVISKKRTEYTITINRDTNKIVSLTTSNEVGGYDHDFCSQVKGLTSSDATILEIFSEIEKQQAKKATAPKVQRTSASKRKFGFGHVMLAAGALVASIAAGMGLKRAITHKTNHKIPDRAQVVVPHTDAAINDLGDTNDLGGNTDTHSTDLGADHIDASIDHLDATADHATDTTLTHDRQPIDSGRAPDSSRRENALPVAQIAGQRIVVLDATVDHTDATTDHTDANNDRADTTHADARTIPDASRATPASTNQVVHQTTTTPARPAQATQPASRVSVPSRAPAATPITIASVHNTTSSGDISIGLHSLNASTALLAKNAFKNLLSTNSPIDADHAGHIFDQHLQAYLNSNEAAHRLFGYSHHGRDHGSIEVDNGYYHLVVLRPQAHGADRVVIDYKVAVGEIIPLTAVHAARPGVAPTAPAVAPTVPAVAPTAPAVAPTVPAVAPTAPAVAPTVPAVAPTAPAVAPTVPAVAPTVPAVAPTVPAVAPTVPVVAPIVPAAPINRATDSGDISLGDNIITACTERLAVKAFEVLLTPNGPRTAGAAAHIFEHHLVAHFESDVSARRRFGYTHHGRDHGSIKVEGDHYHMIVLRPQTGGRPDKVVVDFSVAINAIVPTPTAPVAETAHANAHHAPNGSGHGAADHIRPGTAQRRHGSESHRDNTTHAPEATQPATPAPSTEAPAPAPQPALVPETPDVVPGELSPTMVGALQRFIQAANAGVPLVHPRGNQDNQFPTVSFRISGQSGESLNPMIGAPNHLGLELQIAGAPSVITPTSTVIARNRYTGTPVRYNDSPIHGATARLPIRLVYTHGHWQVQTTTDGRTSATRTALSHGSEYALFESLPYRNLVTTPIGQAREGFRSTDSNNYILERYTGSTFGFGLTPDPAHSLALNTLPGGAAVYNTPTVPRHVNISTAVDSLLRNIVYVRRPRTVVVTTGPDVTTLVPPVTNITIDHPYSSHPNTLHGVTNALSAAERAMNSELPAPTIPAAPVSRPAQSTTPRAVPTHSQVWGPMPGRNDFRDVMYRSSEDAQV